MHATTFAWLVLLFPLLGTIVIGAGWRLLPGRTAGWLGTAMIALSFASAIATLLQILDRPEHERQVTSSLWNYAKRFGLDAKLEILVDPLSVLMILIVSGVSMLIHLYSVSYLTADAGYRRYFSYLNYLVFTMLLLVLGGNFFILIIGWAFV